MAGKTKSAPAERQSDTWPGNADHPLAPDGEKRQNHRDRSIRITTFFGSNRRILMMKALARLCLLLTVVAAPTQAADWDLARNVARIEAFALENVKDSEIDKKFLEILALTEKTKSAAELYDEVKRIATNPALADSRYRDSLLYFMLVRSLERKDDAAGESRYWMNLLKSYDSSHVRLAGHLVRLRQLPKDSPEARAEAEALVAWARTRPPKSPVIAPEYSGNRLFGFKPRTDFTDKEKLKVWQVGYYRSSVKPLEGFQEEDTYISVLERTDDRSEEVLKEMLEIYKNAGLKTKMSYMYVGLANHKTKARDFKEAVALLDKAIYLNPGHPTAKKERDRLKLEMTYQSLRPAGEPSAPAGGQ
jgi:tetratricopeptide (TPR) repeat protein